MTITFKQVRIWCYFSSDTFWSVHRQIKGFSTIYENEVVWNSACIQLEKPSPLEECLFQIWFTCVRPHLFQYSSSSAPENVNLNQLKLPTSRVFYVCVVLPMFLQGRKITFMCFSFFIDYLLSERLLSGLWMVMAMLNNSSNEHWRALHINIYDSGNQEQRKTVTV